MRRGCRAWSSAVALAGLLAVPAARAQPAPAPAAAEPVSAASPDPPCSDPDRVVCGRQYFALGTQAFERADYPAAIAAFMAALSLKPHPVIRFNLGLSLARGAKPRAALLELERVEADPEADPELRQRAQRERAGAEQALARVRFLLGDPARMQVKVDEQPVSIAPNEVPFDPGRHRVQVWSAGALVYDQELELHSGERVELRVGTRARTIDIVVVPTHSAVPAAPDRALQAEAKRSGPALHPAWFWGSLGATLVVTGVTVWSGLDTQSALDDYERDLPRLERQQAEQRLSDGHAKERRTNVLLGASLAGAAATTVLGVWLVDFGHGRAARAQLSPQALWLSGSF